MPRVRKEFVDADYLRELSPEERQWYDKFASEYYGGSFNTKFPRRNVHKSKAKRKDCYDRNNRQNNDLLGVTSVNGLIDREAIYNNEVDKEYVHPATGNINSTEDALIDYIDNKELLEYDEKELEIIMANYDFETESPIYNEDSEE